MKKLIALGSTLALAASLALPAAARSGDDALALVPADAASVGVVRLADLRTSPLAARLFSDTDHITVAGDAQHFLDEAHLNPKDDVDLVVAAGSPRSAGGDSAWGLVIFEGRFEPARLAAALVERGGTKRSTPAGDYYLLPDRHASSDHGAGPAAIAFASTSLVIAGSESAVVTALAQRGNGGTGFASGPGLGRQLSRIDRGSSAWALVDVTRLPAGERPHGFHASGTLNGKDVDVNVRSGSQDAAMSFVSSMKNVQLLALQATAKGDALRLSATGVVSDDETAGLMEDALRGVLAAWRLAAQEKSPETVAMLRKFTISHDGGSVSISGTLPGSAVRALAERKHATAE